MEGITLEELFRGRDIHIPAVLRHLRSVARKLGLPFTDRTMTYNSRRAQEMGKWVEVQGGGDAFHHAVFRAYFAEGRNIADLTVLAHLVETLGLDPAAAREAVIQGAYRDAVDRDWRRSREVGITAVPSFCLDGRILVGAQPYPVMARFVTDGNVEKRRA